MTSLLGRPLTAATRKIGSTMHPAGFHGADAQGGFFEGWYVKLVSADRRHRVAIIPGVFLGQDSTTPDEAFIQMLDGGTGESHYVQFDRSAFSADTRGFDVRIGPNRFFTGGVDLDLPEAGLRCRARYATPLLPWPVRPWSPGIMGWYAWAPRMECYHGVVSLDHSLTGSMELDGTAVELSGGRGYIEKDWGQAFPSGYVWMQSNHFSVPGISLTASTALIPWLTGEFRGFIVGLLVGGRLYRFTTYRQSRTTRLEIDDSHVRWSLRSAGGMRLRIIAERRRGGLLHAPIRTQMHRRVEETLDAKMHIRLTDRSGTTLLEDTGHVAGLEVHGDLERLVAAD